jgi:hypothetical protein
MTDFVIVESSADQTVKDETSFTSVYIEQVLETIQAVIQTDGSLPVVTSPADVVSLQVSQEMVNLYYEVVNIDNVVTESLESTIVEPVHWNTAGYPASVFKPTLYDGGILSDPSYYGGQDSIYGWKINRWIGPVKDAATNGNNPSVPDLTCAWGLRTSLIYS